MKLQTIEVVRNLRELVTKMGLEKHGIFILRPALADESDNHNFSKDLENIDEEDENENISKESSVFYGRYFDTQGQVKNIFIVPSVREIVYLELDDISKGAAQPNEEHFEVEKPVPSFQFSARGGMNNADDGGSPRARLKVPKKRKPPLFALQGLEFLNRTSMIQVYEMSSYLSQILNLKLAETTLDCEQLDLLLLHVNGFDKNPTYHRNKLRTLQTLNVAAEWITKFKDQVQTILVCSNPRERNPDVQDFLQKNLKKEFLVIMTAALDTLSYSRLTKDTDSIVKIRRFLLNFGFNSANYLYSFYNNLTYHKFFNSIKERKAPYETSTQDSKIMRLIDFAFTDPRLSSLDTRSDWFFKFQRDSSRYQSTICSGLFHLKKSVRTHLSSKLVEIRVKLEQCLDNKRSLIDNPQQYMKDSNTILKSNFKSQIMKESYLVIKSDMLPFSTIPDEVISEYQSNIQYHFSRAYQAFITHMNSFKKRDKLSNDTIQNNPTENQKINISDFEVDIEKANIMNAVISKELEKDMVQEGITFYINNINNSTNKSISIAGSSLEESPRLNHEEEKKFDFDSSKKKFLPFLYAFTNKILNNALFVDSLNLGECMMIPVQEVEQELYKLNVSLVEYFDHIKFEAHQKYQGKTSILQNDLDHLNKQYLKVNQRLEQTRKEQERIIEVQVAELNSKLIFDTDGLQKRIKYLMEEHDFNIRETREKTREEFRIKLLDDEISIKKMKAKYNEYKEGMYFDIRKFIEGEKNNTLRMIRDKRNLIFQTQPRDFEGEQEDLFDIEDYHDSEIVAKLYSLLKNNRVLFKFREAVLRESYDKKILDMENQLLANQELLSKVNDLQSTEKNLMDNLTEAKKELAIVERHNNILRKNLHQDQKQKIRLYKKNNESKFDFEELQSKYHDSLKQKAIMVPTNRPETANSFNAYRYHLTSPGSFRHPNRRQTGEFGEAETKPSQIDERTATEPSKRATADKGFFSARNVPMSNKMKLLTESTELKIHPQSTTNDQTQTRIASPAITKSFIDTKTSFNANILGINLKTGKKAKPTDSKNFLVKKFVSSNK